MAQVIAGSVISSLTLTVVENIHRMKMMKGVKVNRRSFLKMLGWGGAGTALAGCDLPTTVTLEEGKEEVVSYLLPEEYVIPGIGVWYASTCTQCDAGCGLHGRVREGRALKLEGNPDSPLNNGKSCMMGQSGVQTHYNPDRVTSPMMRKGNSLQAVSWDEAMAELGKQVSSVSGDRFAFVSGSLSGHQSVLTSELLSKVGSKNHFAYETINTSIWQAVSKDLLGDAMPVIRYDKAGVILSFGADFLATWMSPVHNAGEYAKFRQGERGVLVQVEPKMTLTGGNADLWVPAAPGTEGVLALGIANIIVSRGWNKVDIPASVKTELAQYDLNKVEKITGIQGSKIKRIASLLSERGPALVLAGESTVGQAKGYEAASAVMLLNIIMGSIGTTIEPSVSFPENALAAKQGNTSSLKAFSQGLSDSKYDVVFFYNSNPVYSAPEALGVESGLDKAKFKVALTMFPDETALKADLVLPLNSAIEDWGTHVAAYQGGSATMSLQQPLMEPLYKETKGFGDIMIALLSKLDESYKQFPDYYAYLRTSVKNMPAELTGGALASDESFWNGLLQKGVLKTTGATGSLTATLAVAKVGTPIDHPDQTSLTLIPSARLGLWDGRHANIPWLQEAPDQISKVVWDSWAEMHPHTAAEMNLKNGDIVKIESKSGSIETQVAITKAIHRGAISVPMGQGHKEYGRYAKQTGANSLSILDPVFDHKTGELATHATQVKVSKTRKSQILIKMGGSDVQMGRSFVRTVSADQLRRTEGGA